MLYRTLGMLVTASVAGLPVPLSAQTQTDVTFEIPLNLTKLSPSITKVRVECAIWSMTNPSGGTVQKTVEVPATGGQVVQTVKVVVTVTQGSIADFQTGKMAVYACDLGGFNGTAWSNFGENPTAAAWYLTPSPRFIDGQITW